MCGSNYHSTLCKQFFAKFNFPYYIIHGSEGQGVLNAEASAKSQFPVELIMEFEKEFDIAIPDDQAEKISTVGEAIAYIENNTK